MTYAQTEAQFKYADKKGAKFVITIGDEEVENKKAQIKNMLTGEQEEVLLEAKEIINKIL